MTQPDPGDQSQVPQTTETAIGVRLGIYLEEKKSTIGTGGTIKVTQYRNFWVTLRVRESVADMVLLNDDFRPTGIRETFGHEIITGPGWHFIAEGEKRYQRLRPHLDRLLASPGPKPAAATPAELKKGPNWWEGGDKTPAKDPFAPDKKKKAAPAPKKGGWWDK